MPDLNKVEKCNVCTLIVEGEPEMLVSSTSIIPRLASSSPRFHVLFPAHRIYSPFPKETTWWFHLSRSPG